MNFSYIDNNISSIEEENAWKKLNKILIDLALREDNYYVGSGLGGNNFQFYTFLNMQHYLSNSPGEVMSSGDRIIWNVNWLINTNIISIRKNLDILMSSINDNRKLTSLSIIALAKSKNLRDSLIEYKEEFSNVVASLNGQILDVNKFSLLEQALYAFILCQDLSEDLNNKNISRIDLISKQLLRCDTEIAFISVRKFIGITNILKYRLDDNFYFDKFLVKVNNLINNRYV